MPKHHTAGLGVQSLSEEMGDQDMRHSVPPQSGRFHCSGSRNTELFCAGGQSKSTDTDLGS